MKILFITSTRIGDAAMSTVALNYLVDQHPDAEVTVACGALVEKMFTQFSFVTKVIPMTKSKFHKHWIKLWSKVFTTKWDIVVDIRNSAVSRLICADKKYIRTGSIKNMHILDQLGQLVGATEPLETKLEITEKLIEKARKFIPENSGQVLTIGPTANWIGKIWEAAKFIELIKRLTAEGEIFYGAKVAILAGPGEEEIAYKILNSIPKGQRIDLVANNPIEVGMAALKLSTFYIGHDSGLTHCASAVKTPNLSMFGFTDVNQFHPRGKHCAYVTIPEDEYEIKARKEYNPSKVTETLMKNLTVNTVYDAVIKLYNKTVAN